ncbi:MAG: hypothetical protein MR997_05900 [Bacteroidales bacterium]|nr:hypothetical protein [Bacteroidales bacterium]
MTPEEWDVYNDYREEELKELDNHFRDFDFSEHYANIAERIEKEYANGKDINRKGESDAEGGGDQSNVPVGTLVRGEGLPKEGGSGEVSTGFENVKKDLLRSSDHGERLDREATGEGSDVGIGQAERGNGGVLPEGVSEDGEGETAARVRAEAEEERQRREAEESGARAEEEEKPKYDEHGNLIEQNTDPQPIGKGMFGNIYDQFRGRLKEAFDFLIKRKSGDLLGVFHRDGFGDIDLVWGDKRGGAEHIIDKHVGEGKSFATEEEAFTEIDRIIKTGKKDFENGDKVVFKDGNKIVTVRKNWREKGKKIADKNWVLSAYDKTSADSESPVATNKSLAGSATSVSDGKGNTLSSEKQDTDAKNGDGVEDYAEMDEYVPQTWDENSSLRDVEARLKLLEDAFYYPWEALGKKIFPEYLDFINEKGDLKDKYGSGDKVPKEEADALFAKYAGYIERYNAMREEIYSLRELRDKLEAKMSREQKEEESRREMAELLAKHNGYLRGMSNLRMWNVDRYLSKLKKIDGEVATVSEFIDRWLADGSLRISKREYKPQIDRRKWNRMSGQEQAAWEASHNKLKTEYLVNDYDLGKTAYDYARWLMSQKNKGKLGGVVKEQKVVGAEEVSPREAALRDSLIGVLRDAGVEVVTDVEEGQRVLDKANGDARVQAQINALDKAARTIQNWISNGVRGKVFTIELPGAVLNMIRRAMGRDYNSHNITSNGIVHSMKNHGVDGRKPTPNSIPLRQEDFSLIPYIMTAPDRVEKASMDASGRESVRFYKNLSNGYVVVVEKEYKNSPDDMETITMWAEMSDKATNARRDAAPDTHVQNAILDIDATKIRKDAEDAIRNDEKIRQHKVYHGSGADFDAFDSNHMSEGEGAQAYGWGTYVTEVEAIGRNYAIVNNNSLRKSKLESDIYRLKEARCLKPGGRMFINTRKAGEEKYIKDKIELDSPQEILVKRNGKIASYQRLFTPRELQRWVQEELGAGYSVEIANERNSGTKGLAAVVVTKNNGSPANSEASGLGQPIRYNEDAPVANFDAKLRKLSERTKRLDAIISFIREGNKLGSHEFLHELNNAMRCYYLIADPPTLPIMQIWGQCQTLRDKKAFMPIILRIQ